MKKIEFLEVGMENYGPYIDPMVLTFKPNAITMIVGPNGIGKTMALDAICFTLYGMTSKGLRADDVVNNITKKNCKTWVNFKINDLEYKITRYQKYTKIGSTVIINRNGVDIKKGHKEVLPEIETLICSRKSFLNTLMFGQKVKDFFTDLKDSDKKEIFRSLLDLDKYKKYYEKCSSIIKELNEDISNSKQEVGISLGILENSKQTIAQFEDDQRKFYEKRQEDILAIEAGIEECERMLNKWNEEIQKIEKPNIEQTLKEIEKISELIVKATSSLNDKIHEVQIFKSDKISELQAKASSLLEEAKSSFNKFKDESNQNIIKLKDELKDITEKNTSKRQKLELAKSSLTLSINQLEMRIDELQDTVLGSEESKCPLCEQPITDDKAEELRQLVEFYKSKKQSMEEEIIKIEKDRKKLLILLEDESIQINEKINSLSNTIIKKESELKIKEQEISDRLKKVLLEVENHANQAIKNYKLEFQENNRKLQENKDLLYKKKEEEQLQLNKYQEAETSIANLERDLAYHKNNLKLKKESEYDETQLRLYRKKAHELYISIEKEEIKIKQKLIDIEIFEFWKQAFSSSGIPSMLIDESIPFMNKQVDYYLNLLANGRYVVSFDTMDRTKSGEFRDKISVNVFDSQTRANNRLQLSGGQTRIIDIATILTLGDLQSNIQNVTFNLLIFDEIFDSLDDENINYVSRIMTKLKDDKSIFIISHRHVDQLDADEVLEFK